MGTRKSVTMVASETPNTITTPTTMRVSITSSMTEHEGQSTHDGGQCGHDDGAQTLLAGLQDGLTEVHAFIAELIDELDDEDAVLGRETDEHDEPDLAVNALVQTHDLKAQQCAGDGHRHGEHDGEGMHEALELRGENEEGDEHREGEDETDAAAGFLELQSVAFVADDRAAGQVFADESLHVIESFTQAVARGEFSIEGDASHAVVAVERAAVGELIHRHQIGERDELLRAVAAHKDVVEVHAGCACRHSCPRGPRRILRLDG
jgi:hypothetical protein